MGTIFTDISPFFYIHLLMSTLLPPTQTLFCDVISQGRVKAKTREKCAKNALGSEQQCKARYTSTEHTQTGPRNGFSERTHANVSASRDCTSKKQQFPRTPRNTDVTFFFEAVSRSTAASQG